VVAVTRATQALVLTLLGATLLRLALSDAYLLYVKEWTRIPLLVSGVALVVLAMTSTWWSPDAEAPAHTGSDDGARQPGLRGEETAPHRTSRAAWLMLLPVLVVFVVRPPALGSFVAERQANQRPTLSDKARADLTSIDTSADRSPGPVDMKISDFVGWTQYDYGSRVKDREVRLTGFVSGSKDRWYVSRIAISCCAADAVAYRVRVVGSPSPRKDAWVRITGSWVDPSDQGDALSDDPDIDASTVDHIAPPRSPYE